MLATGVAMAEAIKRKASDLGFLACGITDPEPTAHGAELDAWLARGYAGTMRYLHRQAKRRQNPRAIAPEARSVIVLLDNYYRKDAPASPGARIAKYARGEDYHRVMMRRLTLLGKLLREHGAALARCYVDAGPVPERELAQRAGLGWIAKNTMLTRPGVGSFFFIGSVFTDLELPVDRPFEADRCGTCTRCLDACPTGAFVAPRVLDATRCISYLTIEHKGQLPPELATRFEGYAFGCDICNDVCPWNQRFAVESEVAEYRPTGEMDGTDAAYFERMDAEEFGRTFGNTALERAGLVGMRRNWKAALRQTSAEMSDQAPPQPEQDR